MPVRGLERVKARMMQVESDVEVATLAAAQEISAFLSAAAMVHPWKNRRPHTELTIKAEVERLDAYVKVTLSASYDAALWLELFRGAEYSWLWPVVQENKEEIVGILLRHLSKWGFTAEGIVAVKNPNVMAEADSAKDIMELAREHRERFGHIR